MGIVLTFVLNAGLSLVIGLAVAAVLGPAEYGVFALGWTLALFLCTAVFDWLRLSTTRYVAGAQAAEAGFAASLDRGYAVIAALLLVAGIALSVFGLEFGLKRGMAAVLALMTVMTGYFEYSAARSRAFFRHGSYIRLIVAKNGLGLVLMVAAGLIWRDATIVIAMMALSCIVAVLFARTGAGAAPLAGAAPASGGQPRLAHFASFARYGYPIVAANLIYQAILLVNRGVVAREFGLAETGQLSLATDLSLRLFVSAGAALDAYLFQLAVKRREDEGDGAGRRQIGLNMSVILAVLAFLGFSYACTMPSLEALFVPAQYRGSFAPLAMALLPGILGYCFVQFGLNPIFQLDDRTSPLLGATIVALGLDLALLALIPRQGLVTIAWIHSASLLAGCLVTLAIAARMRGCWPAWRDMAVLALATLAAIAAMWPLRGLASPWLALIAAAALGSAVYASVLVALDFAGARSLMLGRWRARRGLVPELS